MAWTTPRTWVDGETPTAAIFNTHIRDNYNLLKTPIVDDGRVRAFDAATFASLDGSNLTGVAKLASDNNYTAGKQNFSQSRFILPVGVDKYAGTSGNKTAGSAWIEGDYFHWVASDQNEWRYLGALVGTPGGAVVGSVWAEGDFLHYIDSSGEERRMSFVGSTSVHSDAAANQGSVWIETFLHWIKEGGTTEKIAHQDVAHGDGAFHNDQAFSNHGDHNDVAHDDHSDHNDVAHTNFTDHTDFGEPSHGDSMNEHGDFSNHGDFPHDNHSDHSDVGFQNHGDHTDVPHSNHSDHSDVAHTDGPPELIGPT